MALVKGFVDRDATREQIEAWCRERAQALPLASSLVLCRVLGEYRLYTLAHDSAITPHLALDGIWEPWVTMAIARYLKPGMRCLDIGACYGYYSVLMADLVGSEGYVGAWEPYHPALVVQNAAVNGVRVEVVAAAVSTQAGFAKLTPPPHSSLGLFNAGASECAPHPSGQVPLVRCQALRCDLIKIDVEGAERDVWRATQKVRDVSPALTVCLEFTPGRHPEPAAFLEEVQADGFVLGTVGHDGHPRRITEQEALQPDTGDFRMLWLTRGED